MLSTLGRPSSQQVYRRGAGVTRAEPLLQVVSDAVTMYESDDILFPLLNGTDWPVPAESDDPVPSAHYKF